MMKVEQHSGDEFAHQLRWLERVYAGHFGSFAIRVGLSSQMCRPRG